MVVGFLSLAWFFIGTVGYFCFGLLAVILNPFGLDGPESFPVYYQDLMLLVHVPMIWGWIPVVIARLRGQPNPLRRAKWLLILAVISPVVFIAVLLLLHVAQ